jgi:hypothetical protein
MMNIKIISIIIAIILSSILLINLGYTSTPIIKQGCMDEETMKRYASFNLKTPNYIPDGYELACGRIDRYEATLAYSQSKIDNIPGNKLEFIDNGGIILHITAEKIMMGEEIFNREIGNTTQAIIEMYEYILKENPSLNPQLIKVNNRLAWAYEKCFDCGKQEVNFGDGKIISRSYGTPSVVFFYDEDGILYRFDGGIELQELIKMADSIP